MIYSKFSIEELGSDGNRRKYSVEGDGEFGIGASSDNVFVLEIPGVSRFHGELRVSSGVVEYEDLRSRNGTSLNGSKVTSVVLSPGDILVLAERVEMIFLGLFDQNGKLVDDKKLEIFRPPSRPEGATIIFDGGQNSNQEIEVKRDPLAELLDKPIVSLSQVRRLSYKVDEVGYIVLGGGMGSFTFVDHLRVFGMPAEHILVIGDNEVPYANYRRYCHNSQLPDHERLRSNSLSAPDNIWGFPGYASREAWSLVKRGKVLGLRHIVTVFNEPSLAVSYTPKAGQVFDSLDREARRIDWHQMMRKGRAHTLRKTDDGRYLVAYRTNDQPRGYQIAVGSFVHMATGYPAVRFLDDLKDYKARFPQTRDLVINAYDEHSYAYEKLAEAGSKTVVVRGRGIVASRIIQKLVEVRKLNPQLTVIQILRSKKTYGTGSKFRRAKRHVFNDVEIQPFNWPKACWGGDLRREIEKMSDVERANTFKVLGGTTTAHRADWKQLAEDGVREGWYLKYYGEVSDIKETRDQTQVSLDVTTHGTVSERRSIKCDIVLDCTGLISDINRSPLLKDMIQSYGLAQNDTSLDGIRRSLGGFKVTNSFEIADMRNGNGRVYAAGQLVSGGPYAAVDSFLGLQYSALRAVLDLAEVPSSHVRKLGPLRSLSQWLKWCAGRAP